MRNVQLYKLHKDLFQAFSS